MRHIKVSRRYLEIALSFKFKIFSLHNIFISYQKSIVFIIIYLHVDRLKIYSWITLVKKKYYLRSFNSQYFSKIFIVNINTSRIFGTFFKRK